MIHICAVPALHCYSYSLPIHTGLGWCYIMVLVTRLYPYLLFHWFDFQMGGVLEVYNWGIIQNVMFHLWELVVLDASY